MLGEDRAMAERLHALIKASVPDLTPKTWYGMPAYANKAGEIVCFFQPASKFKSRYATLGFSDKANLDDGAMWPTYYFADEAHVRRRVADRRADQESRELRTAQPEVESTSRRKKVGNLPAPKS